MTLDRRKHAFQPGTVRHGKSIYDGAIYGGYAALEACRQMLAAMAALTALTAGAAAKEPRPAQPKETMAPREAGEPIMAIVSIKTQQVTFYDAEGWILRPVSTGVSERETPAGVFAVIEKDRDHHSTMYDDAWMPHMQRITWNGLALHGGLLPGYGLHTYLHALRLCGEAVRQDADRDAGDHLAERRGSGRVFPPGAIDAERGGHRGCSGACGYARSRGRAAPPWRPSRRRKPPRQRRAKRHRSHRRCASWNCSRGAPTLSSRPPTGALAAAKTDQAARRWLKTEAEGRAAATEAVTQLDTAKADAKSKLDAAAAEDHAKAAETKKATSAKAASEAKLAVEPVSIHQPRDAEASRATQHA